MHYKYCPQCGKKLTTIHAGDDGMVPYCDSCKKRWFDTFSTCVIVLTYNEFDEMVLAHQGYMSDKYAVITSGYIKPGETAEETAIREVKEELGLDLETLTCEGSNWFADNDMLMLEFMGFTHKRDLKLSEEVDSAEWVPILEAESQIFPDSPGNAEYDLYRKLLKLRNLKG